MLQASHLGPFLYEMDRVISSKSIQAGERGAAQGQLS
ncbi:hypothetical protein T12_7383 [Trichinella patagoniensis]|uniref:Uncharacterized protein n=1 Tax=Trichinella patagoniensis TaxID=990121 RepID=A0A0V0YRT6_9BILA|nr:hypothetical protein T12_7383 [Trichinella patagoniensis]